MKKILSFIMVLVMMVSALALTACNETNSGEQTSGVKLGLGFVTAIESATNADGETNGKATVVSNVAAILVDKDGKIVDCKIDTVDAAPEYTSAGVGVIAAEYKTKYELGDAYNMVTYGGAKLEWYAQVDAFCTVVKGKTLAEVKALVAENNKGTDAVVTAGCTMKINEFVVAIENAFANLSSTETDAKSVGLGVAIKAAKTDSKKDDNGEDVNGSVEITITVAATAKGADSKVLDSSIDEAVATVKFNAGGAAVTAASEVSSKRVLGSKYGMSAYGQDLNGDGVVKEWFEQADAFENAMIGLDKTGVMALAVESGYGTAALQTAGCTIHIGNMIKAAAKAC